LRYVTRLAWPTPPNTASLTTAFERGEQFHRLLQQYFLGLPVSLPAEADDRFRQWWQAFQTTPPPIPAGRRYPEMSLSVPLGGHLLFGRFDLLVVGDGVAHIFDWKTEREPRAAATLAADWQTRLYLALAVEGSAAVGPAIPPHGIAITYWFANAPQQSVTLSYDAATHAQVWAELTAAVERIERRLVAPAAIWPLTDDWAECARCGYRAYCGRHVPPTPVEEDAAALADESEAVELEPEAPGRQGEG
jgi:hypothetical protein